MAHELPPSNPYSRELDAAGLDPNSSYAYILELAGQPESVLDVGCNTGYLGRLFIERGAKVWGIDNDPDAAAEAEATGLDVQVADLDTTPLSGAFHGMRFDAIVFADVLEHLKRPDRVLAAARQILTDDGLVLISIPNVAHGNVRLDLLLGRFEYTAIGLLDNTHLRFFTSESLAALVAGAGFEVADARRVRSAVDGQRIADAVTALGLPAAAPELLRLLSSDAAETFQYVVAARPVPAGKEADPDQFWTLGDRDSEERTPAYLAVEAVPNVVADMRQLVEGLERTVVETREFFDRSLRDKDEVIGGLEASLNETNGYLERVIADKDGLIAGLEASLAETRAYLESVVLDRENVIRELQCARASIEAELTDERHRLEMLTLPTVTVVVVNWNGQHLLSECLRSLQAQSYPRTRYQVVVVDNGSTDQSVREVRQSFPDVTLIEAGSNLGFAAGNNLAIARSDSDYVALLNNDAAADPDWLLNLVKVAEGDPTIGAVNSKIWLTHDRLAVEIEVSDTFVPGSHDPRRLGASIASLALLDDSDVPVEFLRGAFAQESNEHGPFRWVSASAEVRVPLTRSAPEAILRVFPTVFPSGDQPIVTFRVEGTTVTSVQLPADAPVEVPIPLRSEYARPVVQNAGSLIMPDGAGSDRGTIVIGTDVFYESDRGQFDHIEEVPAFCGAAALLRRQALEEVGAFDPAFFMYYEDTDLSLRLRTAGWRILVAPGSTVRHHHSATSVEWSPRFCYFTERNRLMMLMKNASVAQAAREWTRYTARLLRRAETAENRARFLQVEKSLARNFPRMLVARRKRSKTGRPPVTFRQAAPDPSA